GGAVVYFQNTKNWNSVFAYSWTGASAHLGAWPGTQMTQTTVVNNRTYYYINVPGAVDGSAKIIFSNGNGEQTDDFDFYAGGYYDAGGWTAVETIETDELEPEFYTLQGVRVMNPTPGIYIVRRGNKTSKAVVR
ncbi:MAG: starch-binding protein, partial [Muribaculaceae bacterium]|nr:starch-binding protein [Muribaculaceae bacterium]